MYCNSNGAFTLPENETESETNTDNKYTEPMWICVVISLCAVWTPPHKLYKPFFIGLSLVLNVVQCEYTIRLVGLHLFATFVFDFVCGLFTYTKTGSIPIRRILSEWVYRYSCAIRNIHTAHKRGQIPIPTMATVSIFRTGSCPQTGIRVRLHVCEWAISVDMP